mgnify:CR=1 FL=1
MEKTIKITPPEGYEVDKEKSTFEEIVFKKLEPTLPMSFEELGVIEGCYISSRSNIDDIYKPNAVDENRNLFPTRKEAEAMLLGKRQDIVGFDRKFKLQALASHYFNMTLKTRIEKNPTGLMDGDFLEIDKKIYNYHNGNLYLQEKKDGKRVA